MSNSLVIPIEHVFNAFCITSNFFFFFLILSFSPKFRSVLFVYLFLGQILTRLPEILLAI